MSENAVIATPEEVSEWRVTLETKGKRLVFTNGCFDLLHAGHVRYLAEARALGDALVVALNSDASVRAIKGAGRPVNCAEDRAEVLRALRSVDAVTVFDSPRATELIRTIRPHVYAKGGDYTPETLNAEERAALDGVGAEIRILPLVEGRSTTATLERMRSDSGDSGERKLRLGILGSGKGSNFEAILGAIRSGSLDAEVVVAISDGGKSRFLSVARDAGVPDVWVDPGGRPGYLPAPAQKEMADRLRAAGVDLVILAGFLRILKAPLLDAFPGRILNIHPSLLPKYPGLNAWEQALKGGESEAGCTVHLVNEEVDGGEILAQGKVPVESGDTSESLHARIQEVEHALFPRVIGEYGSRVLKKS